VLISIVKQDQSILENDTISRLEERPPILSGYDQKKRGGVPRRIRSEYGGSSWLDPRVKVRPSVSFFHGQGLTRPQVPLGMY
jgi:hypothetical protein